MTAAVVLTNNNTDTAWGQALLRSAAAVCFLDKRVRFEKPGGEAMAQVQGQMAAYFGGNVGSFLHAFGDAGAIMARLAQPQPGAAKLAPRAAGLTRPNRPFDQSFRLSA